MRPFENRCEVNLTSSDQARVRRIPNRFRSPLKGWLLLALGCTGTEFVDRDNIDALTGLEAVEELRIGSVDDPDVGFSQLYLADVDSDGNVYVLEGMDRQIRVYNPAGSLIRRIGGPGEGPGEFEDPPIFGVHGDSVWAFDMGARRITFFDRAGNVLSAARTDGLKIPLPGRYGYVFPSSMRSDGTLAGWLMMVGYGRDDAPSPVGAGEQVPIPHVRFAASGEVMDTLGWMPSPPPRMQPPPGYGGDRFRFTTIGSRRYLVPDPPPDLPIWMPLSDGYIAVDVPYAVNDASGAFTVTRIGLAGDTVYGRRLTYRPEPYTAVDLDSVAARAARGFGNDRTPDAEVQTARNVLRSEMKFPELKLPIAEPWLDRDGGVWLRREDPPGSISRWVILDAEGEPRGELGLAPKTRPLWSRGDTLWAAEYDENDVPWLVRYRLRKRA